ncbi:MAG: STAS domain-containing protein [Armatimonadota bacterium]
MDPNSDLRSAAAARLHGERMGHLSRIGRADLLAEEMAALADMAAGQINLHAFRKAFFGAGGLQEHWDQHSPQLTEPAPAEVTTAPEPTPSAPETVAEPAEPEEEAPPAPTKEEPPWEELEVALEEAPQAEAPPAKPEEAVPTPAEQAAVDAAVPHGPPSCDIEVTPLGDDKVAVVVRGAFGAAGYGGQEAGRRIQEYLETTPADVVLDLRGVETLRVDSTAAIINCQMKARAYGRGLTVIKPRGGGAALLDAMGLSSRIECLAEDEATNLDLPPLEQ